MYLTSDRWFCHWHLVIVIFETTFTKPTQQLWPCYRWHNLECVICGKQFEGKRLKYICKNILDFFLPLQLLWHKKSKGKCVILQKVYDSISRSHKLCNSKKSLHTGIAHICHNRHNRRWCTFFKPADLFPHRTRKVLC